MFVQGVAAGARSVASARAAGQHRHTSDPAGLRDRALIGMMVYSIARIGAALDMTVEDVYTQNRRLSVRLREEGGRRDAMPCHHNLEEIPCCLSRRRGPARRSEAAAVTYDRTRHLQAKPHRAAGGQRPRDDPSACRCRRHRHQIWRAKLPGNRDYRLSQERRHVREGRGDGASTRTTQLYDSRRERHHGQMRGGHLSREHDLDLLARLRLMRSAERRQVRGEGRR